MAVPWKKDHPPKRILVIRLQATGDVVITLPYIQSLRNNLPADTVIDFLTREETAPIPRSLVLFDHVYAIKGERNFRKQKIYALMLLPRLLLNRYDVVIDLQNNGISNFVRKILQPEAWTEFDRFSPQAAGERNRQTIESVGLGKVNAAVKFTLQTTEGIEDLLLQNGWKPGNALVVLNPAGAFENRNWPVEKYIAFAKLWLERFPESQFLVLGIGKIAEKANMLKAALGEQLIDLVGKTNPAQAFALLQRVKFVLSEDSGLMHMAWVSGIPTVVLFGSTRSDWSRPLGAHTAFLDSSDLPCGNCMLEVCKLNTAHRNMCMTRYDAAEVFKIADFLIADVCCEARSNPDRDGE